MGTKNLPSTAAHERLASAWLGPLTSPRPERRHAMAELDLSFNSVLGRFTGNVSPAALANAWFEWITHLQLSPSHQADLAQDAWKKFWKLEHYAVDAARPNGMAPAPCVEPLPQDRRFTDPAWGQWPFNVLSQGFLLNQQWWHRATTSVRGVSQHHEDVVTFAARQVLDMLAPSNFLLTNPVVLKETLRRGGGNLVDGARNAFDDWQRSLKDEQPLPDDAPKPGVELAITPGKVVFRNALIELIQYLPSTPSVHAFPILFVPAWIMKYYILDLTPGDSMVKYLVDKGYTVFMISWKNPVAEDRDLSMEDYRRMGVMDAIDKALEITGAAQLNAVGYCLGGTLLSIAAATMARDGDSRLASISLFASQVDFKEPGELSLFIDESQISFLEAIMWKQGFLDTRQMAGAFQLLRSNDLIWSRRLNDYLLGLPEQHTDLMAWNADATRMPARMHSEYLRQLFLHNDLAEGRYRTDGRAVALTDIHIPIFSVGTLTDHVAPWRSAFKINLLTDTEVTFLLTSGGHNAGVVSPPGRPRRSFQAAVHPEGSAYIDPDTWQATMPVQEGSWWPAWESWLAARGGGQITPPPLGQSLCDAPGRYVLQS